MQKLTAVRNLVSLNHFAASPSAFLIEQLLMLNQSNTTVNSALERVQKNPVRSMQEGSGKDRVKLNSIWISRMEPVSIL